MDIYIPTTNKVEVKTVRINAKCSDCCFVELVDKNGETVFEHDGYVPSFMANDVDYITLTIDLETCKILNLSFNKIEIQDWVYEVLDNV